MLRNTTEAWGWPTRALHWIVAVMVLGLFAHGLWMDEVPRDQRAFQLWLHATVGASLLAIAAAAFVWWLLNKVPNEPAGTPAWQTLAARLTHWGLYALLFATMLAGWLLVGTMRGPIDVQMFGFISIPTLLPPGSPWHELLEEAHELAAYLMIGLVGLHVAAALFHHFVLRDGVLLRMLGRKPKPTGEPEARLLETRS